MRTVEEVLAALNAGVAALDGPDHAASVAAVAEAMAALDALQTAVLDAVEYPGSA